MYLQSNYNSYLLLLTSYTVDKKRKNKLYKLKNIIFQDNYCDTFLHVCAWCTDILLSFVSLYESNEEKITNVKKPLRQLEK